MTHASVFHFCAQPGEPVSALRLDDETPHRRFRKELIRVGEFVKAADGLRFTVALDMLHNWAGEFARYTAAGNDVPIQVGHTWDAEATRGFVREMFVEGESLYGVLELVGDGIKLADTAQVSIYAEPEHVDGTGNSYTWPIRHVALVPNPCIPGLGPFQPLAASTEEFTLSQESPMDWTKLGELLGITEEMNDENALGLIEAAVTALVAERDELKKKLEEGKDDDKPDDNGDAGGAPDPMILSLASDNRRMKVERLCQTKGLPAKFGERLLQPFTGKALALSLSSKGSRNDAFDAVLDALESLPKIVDTSEVTGPQALVLASDKRKADKEREEVQKEMMELAGLTS